jgi:hypothetical protein
MQRHKLHPFAFIVCLLGISALITGCETVAHYRQKAAPIEQIQVTDTTPNNPQNFVNSNSTDQTLATEKDPAVYDH